MIFLDNCSHKSINKPQKYNNNINMIINIGTDSWGGASGEFPPFHDELVFFLDIIYSKKENNMKFNI